MSPGTSPRSPDSARLAALALALAPGVGCVRYRELVERFGSAEHGFDEAVAPAKREELLRDADSLAASARVAGADVICMGDGRYPSALLDLPDAPAMLFARGALACVAESDRVVAIVGTRQATAYGERVARELAAQLGRAGAVVVSGMARGIDAAAHTGALGAAGTTAAVLGTGVDIPYPAAHRTLHEELAEHGLLLSERVPGDRASRGSFPERNRIIAALARLTIVVEAGRRSGALITASRALEMGRAVAAVPGPIDAPQSAGTNELLRDGAQCIASAEDALALMELTAPPRAPALAVAGADRAVWDALARGGLDFDTLASSTALPAAEVLAAVTRLELSGAVECAMTGEVRRR